MLLPGSRGYLLLFVAPVKGSEARAAFPTCPVVLEVFANVCVRIFIGANSSSLSARPSFLGRCDVYRVLTPTLSGRIGNCETSLLVCGRPCREITLQFFCIRLCAGGIGTRWPPQGVVVVAVYQSSKFTLFSESSLQWRHPGTVCAARNIPAFAQVTFLPLQTSWLHSCSWK